MTPQVSSHDPSWRWKVAVGMGTRPSGLALARGSNTPVPGKPKLGAGLLRLDHGGEFVVDGHHRVAAHLVVAVAQVDRALRVADQAVQRQPGGVADAQPGAGEDLHQQPDPRVADPVEVGGAFELVHDELGDRARRRRFAAAGIVAGIQLRLGRQRCPALLADGVQKPGHRADVGAAGLRVRDLDRQSGQVDLQRGPVESVRAGRARQPWCQLRQPHERDAVFAQLLQADTAGHPPPAPSFDQLPQPQRLHRSEIQAGTVVAGDAEPTW